jgi:hypothetical protein
LYAIRIAPDVPIISAALFFLTHPAPILFAAPSPIAGNHSVPSSLGQRFANSPVSRNVSESFLTISGSLSEVMFSASDSPLSHTHFLKLKMPVPEAIETLVTGRPKSRSATRSLNDSQV